jgi:hypothetical protein
VGLRGRRGGDLGWQEVGVIALRDLSSQTAQP